MEQLQQPHVRTWRHYLSQPLVITCLSAVGVGLAAAIGLYLGRPHQHSPFTSAMRSAAPIPLYYPAKLPPGFRIESSKTALSKGVASLSYTDGQHHVVITEQAKPTTFNFDEFYSRHLDNPLQFPSSVGVGEAGMYTPTTAFASLTTDHTWVILNESGIDSTGHVVFLASEMTLDK